MLFVRRVTGDSMLPTLRPSKLVIVSGPRCRYHIGDVIMFQHNGLDKIKRLTDQRSQSASDGRLEVYMLGDNTAGSTDSRHFGWVPVNVIIGKVIWPRIHTKKKSYIPK
jgi:signal peptidase I